MCKREVQVFAMLVLGSMLIAAGVGACAAFGAQQPSPPSGPIVREVSAVNMPIVCLDDAAVGKPISSCASSRQRFMSATASSVVRWCPGNEQDEQKCVDYSLARWKRFADLGGAEMGNPRDLIEVCTTEKTEGDAHTDCKASSSGSTWSGMKYVWKETAARVPELPPATFTIDPTSGESPLDVTLAWNVPGMAGVYPCTASGDWEGQKAAASSEVIQSVMRDSSYTLTCTDIPGGGVRLSWVPPTTNADGTPLTNAQGFLISYGSTFVEGSPVLSQSVTVPSTQSEYTLRELLPQRWYFAIQTLGNGTKSELSNIVLYDVKPTSSEIQRYTSTVTVTVIQKPAPPSQLEASEPGAAR